MTHWGVLLTIENDSNKVYPSIENLIERNTIRDAFSLKQWILFYTEQTYMPETIKFRNLQQFQP